MSTRNQEYQRQADAALQMALTARTQEYRLSWLKVAESWLRMVPADEITIELSEIDAAAGNRGTQTEGQPGRNTSPKT